MDPTTKIEPCDEIRKASIQTDDTSSEEGHSSTIQDDDVAEATLPGINDFGDIASCLFELDTDDGEATIEDEEDEFNIRRIRLAIDEAARRYGPAVLADLLTFQRNQRNLSSDDRGRKKQLWMRYHLLNHLPDGVDINEYFSALDQQVQKPLVVKSHSLFAGEFPGRLETLVTSREEVEEQSSDCEDIDECFSLLDQQAQKSLVVKSHSLFAGEFPGRLETLETSREELEELSSNCEVDSISRNEEDDVSSESECSDTFCVILDAEDDETATTKDEENQQRDTYGPYSSTESTPFDSHMSTHFSRDLLDRDKDYHVNNHDNESQTDPQPSSNQGDESLKVAETNTYHDKTSHDGTKMLEKDAMVSLTPDRQFKNTSLDGENFVNETGLELRSPSLSPFPADQRGAEVSDGPMMSLELNTKVVFTDELVSVATTTRATNSITISSLANVATDCSTASEARVQGDLPQLDLSLDGDDDQTHNSVDVGNTDVAETTTTDTKQTEEKFALEAENACQLEGDDADVAEMDSLKMNAVHSINSSSTNKLWLGSFSKRMPQVEQSFGQWHELGQGTPGSQEAELADGIDVNLTKKEHLDVDTKLVSDYASIYRSLDPINRTKGTWVGSFNNRLIQVEPVVELEEASVSERRRPHEEYDNISDSDNTTNGYDNEEITEESLSSEPNNMPNGTWYGSFNNCTLQVESNEEFVGKGHDLDKDSSIEGATSSSCNDEIKYEVTTCLSSVEQVDPPLNEDDEFSAPFTSNNSISPVPVASLTGGSVRNNTIAMADPSKVDITVSHVDMRDSDEESPVMGWTYLAVLPDSGAHDQGSEQNVGQLNDQGDSATTTSVDEEVDPQHSSLKDPANKCVKANEQLEPSYARLLNGESDDTVIKSVGVDDKVKLSAALSMPPIGSVGSVSDINVTFSAQCTSTFLSDDKNVQMQQSVIESDSDQLATWIRDKSNQKEATAVVNAELSVETVVDTNERHLDVSNDMLDGQSNDETTISVPIVSDERPEPAMSNYSDSNEKQLMLKASSDDCNTTATSAGSNDVDIAQHQLAPQNMGVSVEEASKPLVPDSTEEMGNNKARITKQFTQAIFKDPPPPDVVSLASTKSDDYTSSSDEEDGTNNVRGAIGNHNKKYRGFVVALHERHGVMLLLSSTTERDDGSHNWQLPGGEIHQCEFIEASRYIGEKKTQLALAAKACAARKLYDQTGLDFRYELDRLVALSSLEPPHQQTKKHVKDLTRQFFFILRLRDNEFLCQGNHPTGDRGKNLMIKLSAKHTQFTFEPELSIAANMVKIQTASKCSEAILKAMDPPKPQQDLGDTQTGTSKTDPNNSGMMAEMLDFLAKTCFCFR